MKRVFTTCLLSIVGLITYAQSCFPKRDDSNGYLYSEVHARVAFPVNNEGRVWVKGSPNYCKVILLDAGSGDIILQADLTAPFYCNTLVANRDSIVVSFIGKDEKAVDYPQTIYPRKSLNASSGDFSVMVYGCMEPFYINTSGKRRDKVALGTAVFSGNERSSYRMRHWFSALCRGVSIKRDTYERERFCHVISEKGVFEPMINEAKLIIGTGDQVYVDAGYDHMLQQNPISAWEYKEKPMPTINSIVQYNQFLNELYNATYSFAELEEAHAHLPALFAIDDHEIRDGWGSQGDEYVDGLLNELLAKYFFAGKKAFIDHQLALSHISEDQRRFFEDNTNTMNYGFEINGIKGYMLDLRSNRDINKKAVMGPTQMADFENWISSLDSNQEVLIVSSIPVSMSHTGEKALSFFNGEFKDDVADSWRSDCNKEELDSFMRILTKYRIENQIKPIIISGDVHKAALVELWCDTTVVNRTSRSSFVLAYELVATGFSHEFIKTGVKKRLFSSSERQKRSKRASINYRFRSNYASVYPMVRLSVVAENFGAVEFFEDSKTKTRLHSFLFDSGQNDQFGEYFIECDWDKSYSTDSMFRFEYAPECDARKPYSDGKGFNAPLPEGHSICWPRWN